MASATTVSSISSLAEPPIQQQQQATRITAGSALGQVLQSEPVRRLFNQPNIVIHAIPRTNSPTAFRMVRPQSSADGEEKSCCPGSEAAEEAPAAKDAPELSIRMIEGPSRAADSENLLPAKGSGKSEILLVPVKRQRKDCGHFEPCESLVCCVHIELGDDDEALVPVTIDDEAEIDAPVGRHCARSKCDALSIDHDRCRAAAVKVHRCDRSSLCDVCEAGFADRTSRLEHKRCRRKEPAYQHHPATPSDVFRYRMRQRELQMIESAKAKRTSDYLDPVTGYARTIEALSRNDELIIIPKMPPFPPKIVKPHYGPLNGQPQYNGYSTSNHLGNKTAAQRLFNNFTGLNNSFNFNNNNASHNKNSLLKSFYYGGRRLPGVDKELTSEMISSIIASCQNSINRENQGDMANFVPTKQIKLSDHGSLNGATVNIMDVPKTQSQSSINFAELSSSLMNGLSVAKPPAAARASKKAAKNSTNVPDANAQLCIPATGLKSAVAGPASANQQQQFMVNAGLQLTSINKTDLPHLIPIKNKDPPVKKPIKIKKIILPKHPYKIKIFPQQNSESSLSHDTQGPPNYFVVSDVSSTLSENAATPKKKKKRKIQLDQKLEDGNKEKDANSINKVNGEEKDVSQENNQEIEKCDQLAKVEVNTTTPPKTLFIKPSTLTETVVAIKPSPIKVVETKTILSVTKSVKATSPNLTNSNNISIVSNTSANNVNEIVVSSSPEKSDTISVVSDSPKSIASPVEQKVSVQTKKLKVQRKRMKKTSKRFKFECNYCPKRFATAEYRRLHVANHENSPEFMCRLCERGFITKQMMRRHEELSHGPEERRCEICDMVLPSVRELAEHMKQKRIESRVCTECPETFDSCSNLDLHQRSHGFLVCGLCKLQVASSRIKRHLMLEHALPKHRVETSLTKLATVPTEDEPVCNQEIVVSPTVSAAVVKAAKTQVADVTRRSSSRRRSSKEFFVCTVCERRFDNEKQFHVHQAIYPKKFTPCPDCGRKFHRKTEYTEHSKTCNPGRIVDKEPKSRKRKSNLLGNEIVLKSDNLRQNSIDQKQNELLGTNKCKELKLEVCVQTSNQEDNGKELENFEDFEEVSIDIEENSNINCEDNKSEIEDIGGNVDEDEIEENIEYDCNSELIIENTIINGLKQNSNDCLEILNVEKSENNDVKKDDGKILLLNNRKSQVNSNKTTVFDKAAACRSIIQDHNYQVLQ